MKSVSVLSILFSVGLVGLAVACTKTITRVIPYDADAGKDAGSLPPPADDDDDTTTGDDDDDTTPPPKKDAGPPDCKKTESQAECASCCGDQHKAGFKIYQDAIKACVCSAEVCGTECKTTLCANKNPTQACATCANDKQQDSCQQPVSDACGADDDCLAWNACVTKANCGAKPVQ